LELVIAKIKNHSLSIRSAERRGMLNLSSSYHYNFINKLGNSFINGKISLQDFLVGVKSNMSIVDATYLKREGNVVYGAKKIHNYLNGYYES